ncbi:MAG: endonuclease/exonuclease/phosphatase family protein [Rhodospirillales bacterium]
MPIHRLFILAFAAALGAATGAAVLAEFGSVQWVGEALANLRLQLALGSALLAIAVLFLRMSWWRRLDLFLIAVALTGAHVLPLLPYISQPPPSLLQARPGAAPLRLLVANLHSWASDLVAVEKLLRESQADIVLLTELTPHHQRVFDAVRDLYPEQFGSPFQRDNTYAVRILARPAMVTVLHHPVEYDYPVVQARFCPAIHKCLTTLSTHAPRPGPDGRERRNTVLQEIVVQTREALMRGDYVIAAGDFNITAFSPDFTMFAEVGLTDSALGRGYPSTWP